MITDDMATAPKFSKLDFLDLKFGDQYPELQLLYTPMEFFISLMQLSKDGLLY